MTLIEKLLASHSGVAVVSPGDVVWVDVDYRSARDFGGPNVVKALVENFPEQPLKDPAKTYFTFDTNAPANTTGYANNQHACRLFARKYGATLYDVDAGVGTHVAIEKGLVKPGDIAVGTDSHFNILGAVGAFGQGMGDLDVAFIFKTGRTWFEVPETIRVELVGMPSASVTAKDLALFLLRELGTEHALGRSVEIYGECVERLDLAGRITVCSDATETGAISFFLPPSEDVARHYRERFGLTVNQSAADAGAEYAARFAWDVSGLTPLISPPPSPNGAQPVSDFSSVEVDSVFIGSCTNGRWEDLQAAAEVLSGRRVHERIMLKVVPTTREVYERILEDGTFATLVKAGAIVTHPGCGGCASGQLGMTGAGEVQVSTSNRNFRGKQGAGDTYLASPRTAAWTALRGHICNDEGH